MNLIPSRRGGMPETIAVLVTNAGSTRTMCPFFGKCDGVLVFDPHGNDPDFLPNGGRSAEALCELILGSRATRLVCGYISDKDKKRLRAAGIDVRLGSCACSIEELVGTFDELQEA